MNLYGILLVYTTLSAFSMVNEMNFVIYDLAAAILLSD